MSRGVKKIFQNRRIYVLFIAVILLFTFIVFLKKFFFINKKTETGEVKTPYEYSQGSKVSMFKDGVISYDGLTLKYIGVDGKLRFDITLKADNFSFSVSEKNIYILDIVSKQVYILNASGGIVNKIKLECVPVRITALSNDNFIIHYLTDIELEGVKLFKTSGEEIQDITYPDVTLTLIENAKDGKFCVMGFFRNLPELKTCIYSYDADGKLQSAVRIDSALISKAVYTEKDVFLLDSDNLIKADNTYYEEEERIRTSEPLVDVASDGTTVCTLDKMNVLRLYDLDFKLIEEYDVEENVDGFFVVDGAVMYYNSNGIFWKNESKRYAKNVLKVITDKEKTVAFFQDEIRIFDLKREGGK